MPTKLDLSAADFETRFAAFLNLRQESEQQVSDTVKAIIEAVRARGDIALAEYTATFDKAEYTPTQLRISAAACATAFAQCEPELQAALQLAAERIRSYHERQIPQDEDYTDATGTRLGWRWRAISDVGMYVPGGMASYPSSVLMNAIPAKVAGVKRLVMVVPTPRGEINPAVLAAAHLAGVDEVYRVGGAQAVAALAYGTDIIRPVFKIVGPGNAYVAEAKRQVFGQVGIDMIAGPSEICVVADNKNDPKWIAADLLSQAEHDRDAQSILITDDADFAARVEDDVNSLLTRLERSNIAKPSWEHYGAVILVPNLHEAVPLIDRIAPEHLELAVDDPDALECKIHNAGAVFLGRHTPEAIGDYIAGPSHVLPTSRTARFSSVLSVLDFMKRTSVIGCSPASIKAIGAQAETLAESEGLGAHALSIHLRCI